MSLLLQNTLQSAPFKKNSWESCPRTPLAMRDAISTPPILENNHPHVPTWIYALGVTFGIEDN